MAGIIEFPQVVQATLKDFGDLFANEAQRRHFAEYLTGLYVADRKTITAVSFGRGNVTPPWRGSRWSVGAVSEPDEEDRACVRGAR